ncbi:MAG TPA: ABC transporter ATP-binding protein, partial [Anaeromyxobacter sp.]|nr:ABC transporter ATP-binding protein [Anaeromyxobacter sp.]
MRSYLRLLRFALQYRWKLGLAIVCMVVLSMATAAYVYLLGPALEFLFRGDPKPITELARFAPASLDLGATVAHLDRP